MKYTRLFTFVVVGLLFSSCSSSRSGSSGRTDTDTDKDHIEIIERYDLDVDTKGITCTLDITTIEGKMALKGASLEDAKQSVLNKAAKENNCARIFSPKFEYYKKGKRIFSISVFGFPARVKNSQKTATPDKEQPNNIIIVK